MRHIGTRILAEGQEISNDTWATGLNNNDVIIGPSGSGKTRGYVKPNLLQLDHSLIVTDTKGALRQEVGTVLEQHGYRVSELNLADPLAYIRYDGQRQRYNEQDILTVSAALVPIEDGRQQFWEMFCRMFLESIIGYVLECLPDNEHNLSSVVKLFGETKRADHKLQMPVRFFLDDSAANVCIPDFDRIISIIRSRDIAVSLIIQSLSRLEAHPLYQELPDDHMRWQENESQGRSREGICGLNHGSAFEAGPIFYRDAAYTLRRKLSRWTRTPQRVLSKP